MQAYHHHHHQMANPTMPNGVPTANLLTTASQMNNNIHQSQAMAAVNSYQDLVRNCLPQLSNFNGNIANNSSMVSFAVRLMSLNHHELRCLNGDPDLVRYINQVHMLIENKLQDLHAKSASALHSQQQQQQQQQQHLFAPLNYYTNYYNQQLRLNQLHDKQTHQQQLPQQQPHHHQQQQQQLLLMGHLNCMNTAANSQDNHELTAIHTLNNRINPILVQQQQQQHHHQQQQQQQQQQQPTIAPALDLRTTPRPMSAMSATPSPIGSRAGSTGSAGNSRQSASSLQHPKKVKLSEYRKMQQLAERGQASGQLQNQQQNEKRIDSIDENEVQDTSKLLSDETSPPPASKRLPDSCGGSTGGDMTSAITASTRTALKKYKGEFDEPSSEEVTERQQKLNVPGHYHCKALDCGECACVIGSEFRDKTKREALELLDRWRSLDIEERIKWKWDVNDLPKDIPLSDIKKFEDLRRDYSAGRADFGGASKRKPLGIRGTRQFLLMLYCLWGHPGREDAMQREGYCPHCFAKIRTDNEQSTLVRVVNHFNMKHRKGANPRLSPHADSHHSPQLASPQNHQVRETLISMVESAVAATEEEETLDPEDALSPRAAVDKQEPTVEGKEHEAEVKKEKGERESSCSTNEEQKKSLKS